MNNHLLEVAADAQAFLDEQGWQSCVIGGIALMAWGEPRYTADVDITLFTDLGNEAGFIRRILKRYPWRTDDDPFEFAQATRVLLLNTPRKIPIDISLGAMMFEKQMIARATSRILHREFKRPIRVCSAEDLVVLKAFANRPRDWGDVESVLLVQKKKLDWRYISPMLEELCGLTENMEIPGKLYELRKSLGH